VSLQIGTPAMPGLTIIPDPKIAEGEVDIFAAGCNPSNSAFRVMLTNNGENREKNVVFLEL